MATGGRSDRLLEPLDIHTGLYLAASPDDRPVKVGITRSIGARLSALQTGNWRRLRVISFSMFSERPRPGAAGAALAIQQMPLLAVTMEKALLSNFESRRLSGEWLDLDPVEVYRAIDELCVDCGFEEHRGEVGERSPDEVQDEIFDAAVAHINAVAYRSKRRG